MAPFQEAKDRTAELRNKTVGINPKPLSTCIIGNCLNCLHATTAEYFDYFKHYLCVTLRNGFTV